MGTTTDGKSIPTSSDAAQVNSVEKLMDGKTPFSITFRQTAKKNIFEIHDGPDHSEKAAQYADHAAEAGNPCFVLLAKRLHLPPEKPAPRQASINWGDDENADRF